MLGKSVQITGGVLHWDWKGCLALPVSYLYEFPAFCMNLYIVKGVLLLF